jgi:hypothetical protein
VFSAVMLLQKFLRCFVLILCVMLLACVRVTAVYSCVYLKSVPCTCCDAATSGPGCSGRLRSHPRFAWWCLLSAWVDLFFPKIRLAKCVMLMMCPVPPCYL